MEVLLGIVCCPSCHNRDLQLRQQSKQGCAIKLVFVCYQCEWTKSFWTSSKCINTKRSFDINKRIVYAMRSIGQGYNGMVRFFGLMNLQPPMARKNFNRIVNYLTKIVKEIAENSMKAASDDLKKDGTTDVSISSDGTWQKRGYTSLNGAVVCISMVSGRILDAHAMSRYCKICEYHQKLKATNPEKFGVLKANHSCRLNHTGSAGAMEVEGAKVIFSRSPEKHNLRYTEYFGDGDSKSFECVKDSYPGIEVVKHECVGHVQKRVGTRLRNLKKTVKGLGGAKRLTDAMVDRLQNYYGLAIRNNKNDLPKMQKAVYSVLFHCASSKDHEYHTAYCPPGNDTWCLFQKDKVNKTNEYKPGKGLPLDVIKHLKPIFTELGDNKLLSKCLHGLTQNPRLFDVSYFRKLLFNSNTKIAENSLSNFVYNIKCIQDF